MLDMRLKGNQKGSRALGGATFEVPALCISRAARPEEYAYAQGKRSQTDHNWITAILSFVAVSSIHLLVKGW
jgi:hypothetical protein